jgi:hypothetical protein
MRNADNTIAKTEAMPDNKGLMSRVTQLIAVERNVAPTDSLRVIVLFVYGWNGWLAVFRIGIGDAERLSVLGV